jgi:hypothetical protein
VAAAIAEGRAAAATEAEDDEFEGLAQLGGTVAEVIASIQEEREQAEPQEIEVWEENVMVVRWFLAVLTQWRRAANGLPTGLDYPGCREVARMKRFKITPDLFDGLQAMEMAYVETRGALHLAAQQKA